MRTLLVVGLAFAALWRGWLDWQSTMLRGIKFRLVSAEDVIRSAMPRGYYDLSEGIKGLGLETLWSFTVQAALGLPLVVLLASVAFALWVTRPLERGRG
ncbi:hypothetical protein [Amaricoccus macauensis]|uniref:hypothetical protein n=1 Tax=Amaricoccus macauensis TaxID=57001 RepID=UPI003C7D508D